MERPDLRLISRGRPVEPVARHRAAPLALGSMLLAAATLATVFGADRVRRPLEARELAQAALQLALQRGNGDEEVRSTLVELRRELGRRPLDSQVRVVYASLLLGLSGSVQDTRIAAFHARRAAELAPVTVPVARSAALVLARTGNSEESLELIRHMFEYEPGRAAELLAHVEGLLLGAGVESGIPPSPEAWLAWSWRLRQDGRHEEAEAWVDRTYQAWPDHWPALDLVAARAVRRGDWHVLSALFPPDRRFPEEPASAPILLHRARLKANRQDATGALSDIREALRLDSDSISVKILAGDAYEAAGEIEDARGSWTRAIHELGAGKAAARQSLLVRLARLEDRHGRPAAALRFWKAVLEIEPDQPEARRRVDDLTGFRR